MFGLTNPAEMSQRKLLHPPRHMYHLSGWLHDVHPNDPQPTGYLKIPADEDVRRYYPPRFWDAIHTRAAFDHDWEVSQETPAECSTTIAETLSSQFDLLTSSTGSSVTTTAVEVENGRDPQGIDWLQPQLTRQHLRARRMERIAMQSNQQRSVMSDDQAAEPEVALYASRGVGRQPRLMYQFWNAFNSVKPRFSHSQLRHLVSVNSTCPNEILYVKSSWDSPLPVAAACLDVKRNTDRLLVDSHDSQQFGYISSLSTGGGLVVLSTLLPWIVVRDIKSSSVVTSFRMSDTDHVTNFSLFVPPPTPPSFDLPPCQPLTEDVECRPGRASVPAATRILTCSNDQTLREWDLKSDGNVKNIQSRVFDFCVNHVSVSPDGRLLCAVGDTPKVWLLPRLGRPNESLGCSKMIEGHLDCGFCSSWHSGGQLVATANQDNTCRVWDIRNLKDPIAVIGTICSAAGSIAFSPDGEVLSVVERDDFIQLFDVKSGFKQKQKIDVFGSLSGLDFTPDGTRMYIGVSDVDAGGILEFRRGPPAASLHGSTIVDWDSVEAHDDKMVIHHKFPTIL